jgi:putative DNA methylase
VVVSPKKLIEVALPLDAINVASAREKSIRHGHPSTLHLWWARRPLAAARAVIFSQLVHDPEDLWRCQNPGQEPNKQVRGHWTRERARLFEIIEDLVKWENTTNEVVLNRAREEIRKAWRETCELNRDHPQAAELFHPDKMPGLHDPFAGGGSIPLEAQRLGLEAYASDLNPVAVLINKAMIEIPPKFANRPPVNPEARNHPLKTWTGAQGLADDVRYYGKWMRDEAFKRIGHLYPKVEITPEMVRERPDLEPYEGQKLTVIAWIWARTVKSPNPAFSHVDVPLTSTFILGSKPGKSAYVDAVAGKEGYHFQVKTGVPPEEAKFGTRTGKAQDFFCLMSRTIIGRQLIREEGKAGRLGSRLMAIVAEGIRGRVYLSPSQLHSDLAESLAMSEAVESARNSFLAGKTPTRAMITGGVCSAYGLETWGQLFTPRQIVTLSTFSDLVGEVRDLVQRHAAQAGMPNDSLGPNTYNGRSITYADSVSIYLAFALSRSVDRGSTICSWDSSPKMEALRNTFSRQALPMTWDFAEGNPLSESSGNWLSNVEWVAKSITSLPAIQDGRASQIDATHQCETHGRFVSTDPPYYDNIGYAELADFFYVWLRRSLRSVFPQLLATIATPKAEELVATSFRHGGKDDAERFFLDGMTQAMQEIAIQASHSAPITIYYAFKQSDTDGNEETASTGWEAFLNAVVAAGLSLSGTWPMRTELGNRMVSSGTNALASSIILVCRPRSRTAGTISRRQFVRMLNEELPRALDLMTRASEDKPSPIAPVDLSQAIIGPGMAIFSRYEAVLEADGTPMGVKTALQLINRFLAEDDFDADTQFCLHWFEQHGWEAGKFGEADTLARAKGTSVEGVRASGVVEAGGGIVRLLRWREYPADWDPATDPRLPVWEALHQLIRAYNSDGDSGAARVLSAISSRAESSRQLAYRLYTLCERSGLAEDARAYNEVVTGWTGIESAAVQIPPRDQQPHLTFGPEDE